MVSVILPTAARTHLLPSALQSIASQTAVDKITRVFVSENGGDRASERICANFPQLPITYIFREPGVTPLQHAQLLMKECLEGEITFILHDDDWWMKQHVAVALKALEANPDAAAYGANFSLHFKTGLKDVQAHLVPWFGANYPATAPVWRLTTTNLLLASLLGLVVHYSCLAMRTEALRQSAFVYDLGNPYDNDRMVLFALGRQGPVLFGNKVTACIRVHEKRDTSNFEIEERVRRTSETTAWLVELSRKPWSLIASLFAQRIATCPDLEKRNYLITQAIMRPWCLSVIAQRLDRVKDKEFFSMYDQAQKAFAGHTMKYEW